MSLLSILLVYPERTWFQDGIAIFGRSPVRCLLGSDCCRNCQGPGLRKRSPCLVSSGKGLAYCKLRVDFC